MVGMTTTHSWQTYSPEETEKLGEAIGQRLRGGELIELVSDLGGGKTTFTHGLVRGLGSDEQVASPTFTISREYTSGRLHVYHYDLYRLHEMGVVGETLSEVLEDETAVVVVEWGGVAGELLPEQRIRIALRPRADDGRDIELELPDSLRYVAPEES